MNIFFKKTQKNLKKPPRNSSWNAIILVRHKLSNMQQKIKNQLNKNSTKQTLTAHYTPWCYQGSALLSSKVTKDKDKWPSITFKLKL